MDSAPATPVTDAVVAALEKARLQYLEGAITNTELLQYVVACYSENHVAIEQEHGAVKTYYDERAITTDDIRG